MKVIVGMSGGVDSSVTAHLLQQEGYEVEGVFMKNWDEDDGTTYCTALADLADAQSVCDTLGIRLHAVNFAAEYWDQVFARFLSEYRAGRTPNPDILCNKEIKFRAFLDYAMMLGADRIATGHYAQLQRHEQTVQLLKGVDPSRDQSYFLYAVARSALEKSLFPVGGLYKTRIRQVAEQLGLKTAQKKDSTGICFIGERRFAEFLRRYLPAQPGMIETPQGQCLGEHQGLMFYTEGQRQGLGIGGRRGAQAEPWYVLAKDVQRNVLVVGQGDHPGLYAQALWANEMHWIQSPEKNQPITAKIRYRQQDQRVTRLQAPDAADQPDALWKVEFAEPQRAISPGQSVVFYQGMHCLGGGVIHSQSD